MKRSASLFGGLLAWPAVCVPVLALVVVDPTFDPGEGPDGEVRVIVVHRGDRILIGGNFQHYQGVPRSGLARLFPTGSLDATFDPTQALAGEVEGLVPVLETKVLVGGRFSRPGDTNAGVGLVRLEWDGSRDPAFAPPLAWREGARVFRARIFGTFSTGGWFPVPVRFGVAPDGSVVLDARPFRVAGRVVDTLVRLRPDGSWDESFRPEVSLRDWDVHRVAVAPDGSVWVAGHLGGSYSPWYGLVHLKADGTWDRQFSPEGLPRHIEDIALLPGGEVVGYGLDRAHGPVRVFRLLADGRRDPAFAPAELSVLPGAMAVNAAGEVLLTPLVASVNGIRREGLAWLDARGQLAVNLDLARPPDCGGFECRGTAATFDRQGRLLMAGNFRSFAETPRAGLVRLEQYTGQQGVTRFFWSAPSYGAGEGARSVRLLCVRSESGPPSAGAVYLQYATVPGSAREGSDYVGRSGLVVFGPGEAVRPVEIPILDDELEETTESFQVVLWPMGEAQPEGSGGEVATVFIGDDDATYHVATWSSGEITVSESSQRASFNLYITTMARWSSEPDVPPDALVEVEYEERGARVGRDYLPLVRPLFEDVSPGDSLDPFGVYARWTLPVLDNAEWDGPRELRLRFRGRSPRVVFTPSAATVVIRFTDNDTAAGAGRFIHGSPDRLAAARGGRWLLAGAFDAVDGLPRPGLARLEPDGAVDEGFAPTQAPDGPVQVFWEEPEGGVLVAGQFRRVGELPRSSVARYHPDGRLDETFVPPDIWDTAEAPVNYLLGARLADGRVVLGGVGRFHGPGLIPGVVRLLSDGRPDPAFQPVELGFSELTALTLDAEQRVVVAGRDALTGVGILRRLRADGRPDPEWEWTNPAALQALWGGPEGSLWVGIEAGLLRLPPGRSAPPGTALAEVAEVIHAFNTVALAGQPDGRVLAAWWDGAGLVGRFSPDGTPDTGFNRFTLWPPALAVADSGVIGTLRFRTSSFSGPRYFSRHSPTGRVLEDLRIERLVRLPSGEVHGRLRGQGNFWAVQRSTRLKRDWVDVFAITNFPVWPPFNFVDPGAAQLPHAFYRLR